MNFFLFFKSEVIVIILHSLFKTEKKYDTMFIIEGEKMDNIEKNKNKKMGFNLKEISVIIIITALLTSLTAGVIVYNQNKLTRNLTYQDLNEDNALKEFLAVYASLVDEYYEDVDKTALLESAISAMFKHLGEDYSTYMNKTETDALAEKLLGEYKGIGIEINKQNTIANFIEGSSAKEAGLLIGDTILSINDAPITSADEIKNKIQEINIGEKIKIIVNREGNLLEFYVENKHLYIPAVNTEIFENSIGYLKISTFSNTLKEQVNTALKNMESKEISSLIIDLRNNTGGYLVQASEVANLFLEKGKIIYSLEDKENKKDYKDETDEKREYKIVLLMNEATASASEVLIAALKESYGALTVGTTTYGKGKVQQTHSLEDGSMVKYTSAKWLTPNGTCIDGVGITPEYIVEESLEETKEDIQLKKAIELAK